MTAVGASDGVQSSFRVNESSVLILTDMGFLAEDIRRLATALRTNSISTLTTHLLELSSMPPVTSSAGSSSTTAATALDTAVDGVAAIPEQGSSSVAEATAIALAENTTTTETVTDVDAVADGAYRVSVTQNP